MASGATLKAAGTFPGTPTFTAFSINSGSTVEYYGTTNQAVSNSVAYGTLKISGTGTKTLAANTNVAANLKVTAGTLDLSSFTVNRRPVAAARDRRNGATLKIGGTNPFPSNYSTHTLGTTSTVEYNGTSQTVTDEDYGHLKLSGSGTKTMPATAVAIAGNFTVTGTRSATAASSDERSPATSARQRLHVRRRQFSHSVRRRLHQRGGIVHAGHEHVHVQRRVGADHRRRTHLHQPGCQRTTRTA